MTLAAFAQGLAPLPPHDRAESVERAIASFIARSNLAPGDRLPTERQLMEALAVGRSTVREVIRKLQALGVRRIAQGQRHLSAARHLGGRHPHAA